MLLTKVIKAINGATASADSAKYYVGGAKRIGFLFRRAAHSAGSSAFSVKGSVEDRSVGSAAVMTTLAMIENLANTNAQNLTRVTSKTLNADGDAILWLDPHCLVNFLQVSVVETTDGAHSADIILEFEDGVPEIPSFS